MHTAAVELSVRCARVKAVDPTKPRTVVLVPVYLGGAEMNVSVA